MQSLPRCAVKSLPLRSNFHSWKLTLATAPLSLDADTPIKSRGWIWRRAVMKMLCVTEVRQPKERREHGVPASGLEQTAGVAQPVERQAVSEIRLRFESQPTYPCPKPQVTRCEYSGCGRLPQRSECIYVRAPGLGAGSASQTKNESCRAVGLEYRRLPPLWVGERGCQYGSGANGRGSADDRHRRAGKTSGGFGLTAELVQPSKSLQPKSQTYAPDTVSQERCRDKA